jgi:hypothetical protein
MSSAAFAARATAAVAPWIPRHAARVPRAQQVRGRAGQQDPEEDPEATSLTPFRGPSPAAEVLSAALCGIRT